MAKICFERLGVSQLAEIVKRNYENNKKMAFKKYEFQPRNEQTSSGMHALGRVLTVSEGWLLVRQAAERTLLGPGKVCHRTDAFLLFSAILLKDIKCTILSSPNILYPSLLGALGGSNDSGTCPRSHDSGWARSTWHRFLAQNENPPATVILPYLGSPSLQVQRVVWPW